jgi:hypothetical protein
MWGGGIHFPWYDTGHIENIASNNSSSVACVFVTAVTFLPSRCLATLGDTLSLIRHGPRWKQRVQHFFSCCVCVRYRGNVSTTLTRLVASLYNLGTDSIENTLPPAYLLVFAEIISSTLKMEAICSSETSVATQQTTRRHIPEDDTLHNHRCGNLKSYTLLINFTVIML